jgi:glyoxylase-like metal-dependent hydrolase (beta-lactamase superfamily II)
LPVVTFDKSVTFYWNGDVVEVRHVQPAHTDGDAVVYFRNANVLHMGDTFFNGSYPYIDLDGGGSVDGLIAAGDMALDLVNGDTRIIPGHGPVSGRVELEKYLSVVRKIRDSVAELVAAGKTAEEVVAARPSAAFDAEWGGGFMSPERFVGILYRSLSTN